ncbi:MAG: T9SS type A sorting domain-containing protein [Bacteroidales bacterium]|nr:T9SS type A sorting domain-containing protein [Bacteroidales bacterium]
MKKIFLSCCFMLFAAIAFGQTVVELDLPDPCSNLSVEEVTPNQNIDFSIFPNPTDGNFTLSIESVNSLGQVKMEISDPSGAIVLSEKYRTGDNRLQTLLNVSNLSSGFYFITLYNKEGRIVKKLIVK